MGVAIYAKVQIKDITDALPSVEDIQKRIELAEIEYNLRLPDFK